jgi:DNA-binding transcriptional MerR regulator
MSPRPELPVKLYYRIGEVAEVVGVEPHVLRYWETEFGSIRPQKSPKGQRVYSRRDLEKLMRVRELLYEQGYTIAGAKKRLRDMSSQKGEAASVEPTASAPTTLAPAASAPALAVSALAVSAPTAAASTPSPGALVAAAAPAASSLASSSTDSLLLELRSRELDAARGQMERTRAELYELRDFLRAELSRSDRQESFFDVDG